MPKKIDPVVQTISNLKFTLTKEKPDFEVKEIPKEQVVPTLLSLIEEMHYRIKALEREIGPGDSFIDPRDDIHPAKVTSL